MVRNSCFAAEDPNLVYEMDSDLSRRFFGSYMAFRSTARMGHWRSAPLLERKSFKNLLATSDANISILTANGPCTLVIRVVCGGRLDNGGTDLVFSISDGMDGSSSVGQTSDKDDGLLSLWL